MCGRFVRTTSVPKITKRFKVKQVTIPDPGPSHNIAPTYEVLIVNNEGVRKLILCKWGFTIITTTANELLKPIHDRMPVIIPKDEEDLWLDPSIQDKEQLIPLLKPYAVDEMETWEVSPRMNRPGYDSPENIRPV